MSHGDSITKAPPGFAPIADTDSTPFAALADVSRNLWGIQFHPEVVHTPGGKRLLRNFVYDIAKAPANWTPGRVAEDAIAAIATQVGPTDRVLCALSGGVDSAVAAALIHRAIGDRLVCVYVDHGLMRKRESDLLREVFANTPSGGAFASCIADSCVLISLALQHGIAPATLARSLGRVPVWIIRDGQSVESTGPASPIGAILGVLLASAHPDDGTP
jgi:hypothetical protein